MTRLRAHGTLRERKPLRDRVREWLWITGAGLIILGGMYGTWHR